MIAFGTSADRLPYWVRATWLYIYDYLGTKGNMNVQWEHDPVDKIKLTSVSVNMRLSKKDQINPLAYKLTIFISTGTIQVQGNDYNPFVSSHFKVIITLVNKLMGICENKKSESTDADQTIPKGFHDQEKPSTPSRIPVRSATTSIQPFTEVLTNVKLDLKSDLEHLGANFSEALGKFSEAFVQHLQTELKKVTDKDSLCTEIKSSSKMVITDQSKDPANVVQDIQNLNDTISKQNMETLFLKHKVQSLTLDNKTKQNEMDNKLQVMRSDYELEIAKLQSKLDTQSQLTSDAKQQLNHTTHILSNSVDHLEQKLVSKNSEIANLEGICANLRLDLETKNKEILSLKIHAANSISFNEKSYDTKIKQQSEPTKPKILLIGTSNIKGIDEERLSAKFVTHKCTAYTFE